MNILKELENYIKDFNDSYNVNFSIDTIRVDFNKTYTLPKLKKLGEWKQLKSNSNILAKIYKKEGRVNVTKAYRLNGYDIYYYNMKDAPQYRKAKLEIFGMKQYHDDLSIKPINKPLIKSILNIVCNSTLSKSNNINIDVCYDIPINLNIKPLTESFKFKYYYNSRYINTPDILGVDRILIYDKALKNKLESILFRIETTIYIHNLKSLYMPLDEIYRDIIIPLIEYTNYSIKEQNLLEAS